MVLVDERRICRLLMLHYRSLLCSWTMMCEVDLSGDGCSGKLKGGLSARSFFLSIVMEAKGRVVPGLASRKGHRAFVNSLAEVNKKIVADK